MKKFLIFVLTTFLWIDNNFAQYNKGIQLFDKGYYLESIPYFKNDLKGKNKQKSTEKLAQALYKTRNFNEAEYYFSEIVKENNLNPEIYLEYGEVLLSLGKIKEAQKQFKAYSKQNPTDKKAELFLKICKELTNTLFQEEKIFTITEVKSINTEYNEFSPVIHPKGLIFCSDNPINYNYNTITKIANKETKIYLSEKPKNSNDSLWFNLPKIFAPELNHALYTGPISFNEKYTYAAFNSIGKSTKNPKATKYSGKIYFAENKGYSWFNITPFEHNSDDYSCLHPALSPDGKTMVFAANMPDSYGEFDLYVSYKTDKGWSKPQNLGININTAANEVYPYISSSGVLYFSSNGHIGLGGLDIFFAEPENIQWSKPINAGQTLNSNFDDFGITLNNNETSGFFSSNRKEGKSNDDIYAINISYSKNTFRGKILLSENINDGAANVKLLLITPNGTVVQQATTDKNGFFKFSQLPNDNNYLLTTTEQDSPFESYKKIYLADYNNQIRKKTTTDEKGIFVFYNMPLNESSSNQIEDDTRIMITGSILYGENPSKPLVNQNIELVDENGNILAKAKTDNYGGFKFTHLDPEKNYMIKLDEKDTKLALNTKVIITDSKGKTVKVLNADNKGTFKYQILRAENNSLRVLEEEDTSIKIEFKGKLLADDKNQTPISQITVSLIDNKGKIIEKTTTDAFGNFKFVNLPSDKSYMIIINEEDAPANIKKIYIANEKGNIIRTFIFDKNFYKYELLPEDRISLTEIFVEDPWLKIKDIKENKKESIIVIENIYYDYGKWNITSQAATILDKVVNIMKENPNIYIELSSHTDSRSSAEFNLELSKKRAKSAVDYIISKGIDKNRISGVGMGESKLINYCSDGVECTEEQHAQNRRTEFKVLNQKIN